MSDQMDTTNYYCKNWDEKSDSLVENILIDEIHVVAVVSSVGKTCVVVVGNTQAAREQLADMPAVVGMLYFQQMV